VTSQIRLDILNESGQIIRTFFSKVEKKEAEEGEAKERDMATGFIEEGMTSALKTIQGTHRFHWDMRHAGPWDKKASKAFNSGPLASPGNYSIRLTVDDDLYEQSFKIKADQNILKNGVSLDDLKVQENLALKMVSLISKAKRRLQTVEESLKVESPKKDFNKKMAEALVAQLKTDEGRYRQPALIDQMSYLFSMLKQADQRPGKDAFDRYEELLQIYDKLEI